MYTLGAGGGIFTLHAEWEFCLKITDIVITDTYRSFNSIRYGAYGSFARGFGGTGGQSRGESVTIGKITFLSSGKPIISLNGVTDPNGLKRLTMSVKKALYLKKELQRFLTGVKDGNHT